MSITLVGETQEAVCWCGHERSAHSSTDSKYQLCFAYVLQDGIEILCDCWSFEPKYTVTR